jgi:hypothetical protein
MSIEFLNELTIDIEKIPDYHEFKNNTFNQQLDSEICHLILATNNPHITDDMKENFKETIVNNLNENDILETKLYQESNIGRFYYKDDKTISNNLFYNLTTLKLLGWKQIDIQKSGLSILSGVAKNANIETPLIDSIIENFNGFMSNLKTCNSKKYKNLHYMYIKRIIYNSIKFNRKKCYNEWKNNFDYNENNYYKLVWNNFLKKDKILNKNLKNIYPNIHSFYKEVNIIKNEIYKNNPIFKNLIKKQNFKNDKERFPRSKKCNKSILLVKFIEIIENHILWIMYKFLKQEEIFENNFVILEWDGIFFKNNDKSIDYDDLIVRLNKYITDEISFKITTKMKSLYENEYLLHDVIEQYHILNGEEYEYDNDDSEDDSDDDSEDDDSEDDSDDDSEEDDDSEDDSDDSEDDDSDDDSDDSEDDSDDDDSEDDDSNL